jgi:hypothetical protein
MNAGYVNNGWGLCHKLMHVVAKVKTYVHHYSIARQSLQSKLAVRIRPILWQAVVVYTLQ